MTQPAQRKATASLKTAPHGLKAILFDLDGTLTCPLLNFDAIRSDAGIEPGRPILEALTAMSDAARDFATKVLLRHEREAAEASTLNAGCRELLAHIRTLGLPMAIITRNSLDSTRIVLETHGLSFPVLVTREDEPYKPRPEPLFLALSRLGLPGETGAAWMIGDGSHDIEAGNAAGIKTVWISHGQERRFAAEPWREVRDLHAIRELLS